MYSDALVSLDVVTAELFVATVSSLPVLMIWSSSLLVYLIVVVVMVPVGVVSSVVVLNSLVLIVRNLVIEVTR